MVRILVYTPFGLYNEAVLPLTLSGHNLGSLLQKTGVFLNQGVAQ